MDKIFLYNTLSRAKEEFKPSCAEASAGKPIKKSEVGIYTCGPTVYNYAHLGNLRAYLFEDILKRVLLYNGYGVRHVMNITDVGHLTGDRDMGEDKLEKGAAREGKTAWEIAEFYTAAFKDDIKKLNILEPDILCKATEHIQEQIEMIKILEAKGYTYKTSDGIYYDTAKFKDYNKLSHLDLESLREGARVEINPEKKNPTDFALWKFSTPSSVSPLAKGRENNRQMEWDSPWGIGFPGWHIECSAMSIKYLGDHFDIHCGGIDHINVHHTNEIAQTEAATGKSPWVNYWLHSAFLNIAGGKKMAKSEGNFLTIQNALVDKGINPLAYRFAALQTHYRKPMEYGEEAMKNADRGLEHLYNQVKELGNRNWEFGIGNLEYGTKFLEAINDDLNMPQALAVVQELLKSKLPAEEKLATILDFDKVLGLNIEAAIKAEKLPDEVARLLKERTKAREEKNWAKADRLRGDIAKLGYAVEDAKEGMRVMKIK